jgi:hypothetical protein
MRTRRGTVAAATSLLCVLAGASATHAATVTVTGDDGNPVPLSAAGPASIRQMDAKVGVAFATNNNGYFSLAVTGPDGVAVATPMTCYSQDSYSRYATFRGNGAYTVTVTNYAKADTACKTPTSTETYTYTINSGVAITPPPGPFLTRNPNSYATNTLSLPFAGNPGAGTYDVQYALGAVLNPDGSISGSPQQAFVNTTTGTIDLSLRAPGTYTVVARAKNGDYYSPWSAPVTVTAIAPFDLAGITFPDARGPSYQIRGTVNDTTIRGTVTLALARLGKKNRYGAYHSIGKAKISSKSTFTRRFTERRTGTYHLRVHYTGSALAPATSVTYKIRITRRLFYR